MQCPPAITTALTEQVLRLRPKVSSNCVRWERTNFILMQNFFLFAGMGASARSACHAFGTSRGPSPLALGLSDVIPIAVAFQEVCHVAFKYDNFESCFSFTNVYCPHSSLFFFQWCRRVSLSGPHHWRYDDKFPSWNSRETGE